MIEIEFRGKVINCKAFPEMNGQFYYGYYLQDLDKGEIKHYIYNCPTQFEIDPKTLGQYLNLKDSKGNKIYHGDKLDFDEREWGGKFEPEVILYENIIGEWDLCGSKSDLKSWRKVIGNIHNIK